MELLKTKDFIIIAVIVIGGNALFNRNSKAVINNYTTNNEIQLIRDTIIRNYEKSVDSSRNYVERLPTDSSYNILNEWINARIDGTRYNLPVYR